MRQFLAFIMILAATAAAQMSIGVDFLTSMSSSSTEFDNNFQNDVDVSSFNLRVYPSLIIVSGDLEIVPTFGFNVSTSSVNDNSSTDFGFGGGCGVYFRLLTTDLLRLSLGPQGLFDVQFDDGNDNSSFSFTVGMPFNTDVLVSDRIFFRVAPRLAAMTFTGTSNDNNNSSTSSVAFEAFSMWPRANPYIGVYWNF